ncbi:MAG TPA: M28 family peptidase [Gaiellaceae bacterium]|nr:M28 family peptidase [Gaiellaceae bacterium]
MAAVPPAPQSLRRPRPGSLDRPVNGRLYRGTWLLVGLPLLVLAFSVARPPALQPPNLPPAFDRGDARALAAELALTYPGRVPGTPGADAAARWFAGQLTPYGYAIQSEPFSATIPGRGRVRLVNLVVEKRGLSHKTIVVLAHRDDSGVGPGANDNASGTAALIELARAYAPTGGAAQLRLPYSLLFLSTDGGSYGGLGAAEFAARSPQRQDVIAVVDLDAVAGRGQPRLELAGDTARSPASGLVETVRAQIAAQTGSDPLRASALRQLVDLGFPFSMYEQAPFVARGIPAVTITTAPDRPPSGIGDGPTGLDGARLGQVGRATQNVVDALEQGIALPSGPSSYVYLGSRVVRGWAIEIVLVAALLPFLVAAVDLFARCRRRRIRIAPALRSYRSRAGFWAWCGGLFALFGAAGAWSGGAPRPPLLTEVHWPATALAGIAILVAVGWLVARHRLFPRRPLLPEEALAGHTGALLALAVVALLVVATNPFALVFLLPSLHAWLWLPQVRGRAVALRAAVLLLGFAGPALLVWSFAARYGLGLDAPWYIAWLYSLRYAPAPVFVIGLAWAAAAAQLVALSAGRYAPYPSAAERPPRGPIRETIRQLVLARRRHASDAARRALHG